VPLQNFCIYTTGKQSKSPAKISFALLFLFEHDKASKQAIDKAKQSLHNGERKYSA
jgi:hypothetical protein